MGIPVFARRAGYRVAYRILQLHWLLTHPEVSGVKCLLTDESRLLLVRHTYGRPCWDLPGGRIERSEAPLACARREMREELGLDGLDWEPFGELAVRYQHRRDTLHLFRCELAAPPLVLDLGELAAARWFARAELPADLAPWVIAILARTTVRRPPARPPEA